MRSRLSPLGPVLAVLLAVPADAADDASVRALLERLSGTVPIQAELRFTYSQRGSELPPGADLPGTVSLRLRADEAGLTLSWPADVVAKASAEAQITDPDLPKPLSRAMGQVRANELGDYLQAATVLQGVLRHATPRARASDTVAGRQAIRLDYVLAPPLNKATQKYVKAMQGSLSLWLAEDGTPIAAKREVRASGRAFMVLSFESSTVDEYRFERHGDRLVVVWHKRVVDNSGGGQNGGSTAVAELAVASA